MAVLRIISHSKRIIYTPIPKCGCSSLKLWFLKTHCITSELHPNEYIDTHPEITAYHLPENHEEYFKFTFIRNPWARLVSGYINKICDAYKTRDKAYPGGVKLAQEILGREDYWEEGISFEQFILHIVSQGEDMDMHWRPQIVYIDQPLDFVGTIEFMATDFQFMIKKYIPEEIIDLKWVNALRYTKILMPKSYEKTSLDWIKEPFLPEYHNFYNDELREVVRERYSEDVRIWKEKIVESVERL